MPESHYQSFVAFVTQAIDKNACWYLSVMITHHKMHKMHKKRRPLSEKPSEARTKCTIVVKAFKDIRAISMDHAGTVHDMNGIYIESCKGIITSASWLHDIAEIYATSIPNWLTRAFLAPELQRQRINITTSTVKVILSGQ